MYNIDSGNLGAKTGFVFAGTSVLLFSISWFVIPETAGLTVEDIGTLLLSLAAFHVNGLSFTIHQTIRFYYIVDFLDFAGRNNLLT